MAVQTKIDSFLSPQSKWPRTEDDLEESESPILDDESGIATVRIEEHG